MSFEQTVTYGSTVAQMFNLAQKGGPYLDTSQYGRIRKRPVFEK